MTKALSTATATCDPSSETISSDADSVTLCRQRYDHKYYITPIVETAVSLLRNSTQQSPTTPSGLDPLSDELPDDLSQHFSRKTRQIVSDNALQRWDGYVVKICEDTFVARLTDLTNKGQADSDEAEIPLDELDDEDRAAIAPGKIFSWTIGYRRTAAGQKLRVSRIKFRQLPQWTARQIEKGRAEAQRVSKKISWD